MTHDTIRGILASHSIPYTLHSHVPLLTLRDIEEHVTFPIEGMVKTMAFRIKPSTWVLVALGAYRRVDYRKLADALGVKRGALVQASPEEVEAELGFRWAGWPLSRHVRGCWRSTMRLLWGWTW